MPNPVFMHATVALVCLIGCGGTATALPPGSTQAAGSSCSSVSWSPGVNYAIGTVVSYPPNGEFYRVVNVGPNGSNATIPTIIT